MTAANQLLDGDEAVAVEVVLLKLLDGAVLVLPLIQSDLGVVVGIVLLEPGGNVGGQLPGAVDRDALAGLGLLVAPVRRHVRRHSVVTPRSPARPAHLLLALFPVGPDVLAPLAQVDLAVLVDVPLVLLGLEVLAHLVVAEVAVTVLVQAAEHFVRPGIRIAPIPATASPATPASAPAPTVPAPATSVSASGRRRARGRCRPRRGRRAGRGRAGCRRSGRGRTAVAGSARATLPPGLHPFLHVGGELLAVEFAVGDSLLLCPGLGLLPPHAQLGDGDRRTAVRHAVEPLAGVEPSPSKTAAAVAPAGALGQAGRRPQEKHETAHEQCQHHELDAHGWESPVLFRPVDQVATALGYRHTEKRCARPPPPPEIVPSD